MTELLLDFRWDIDSLLDHSHDASAAVTNLINLSRQTGLPPGRFIDSDEVARFWDAVGERTTRNMSRVTLQNFDHLVRRQGGDRMAAPRPAPTGNPLRDGWKRSLFDQLAAPDDWRTPHIVVTSERRADWPAGDEIEIVREGDGADQAEPLVRNIAVLADYAAHRYCRSDNDPWVTLEHHNPPGNNPRVQFPCHLPKPPNVVARQCGDLMAEQIAAARMKGWFVDGRYFYVPPATYQLLDVTKPNWRNGNAFPQATASGREGPVDSGGRVWLWHGQFNAGEGERHWDVQLTDGSHVRISHTGAPL